MKKFTWMLLSVLSLNAYAQIYITQEANGDIIYSDVPTANAKPVVLSEEKPKSPPTEINADKTTSKIKNTPPKETNVTYKTFRIISPVDQETIQNQPALLLNLKVDPQLNANDKIQIIIDGKQAGALSSSTHINVGLVERGAHEVYGLIVDKNKRYVMQSNVITIYVQQAHTGKPNQSPQANPKKVSKSILKKKAILAHNH